MLRSIFLPGKVTADQAAYYVDLFKKVTATPEWKQYLETERAQAGGAHRHRLHQVPGGRREATPRSDGRRGLHRQVSPEAEEPSRSEPARRALDGGAGGGRAAPRPRRGDDRLQRPDRARAGPPTVRSRGTSRCGWVCSSPSAAWASECKRCGCRRTRPSSAGISSSRSFKSLGPMVVYVALIQITRDVRGLGALHRRLHEGRSASTRCGRACSPACVSSAVLFWVFEIKFAVPMPKGPLEALFGY